MKRASAADVCKNFNKEILSSFAGHSQRYVANSGKTSREGAIFNLWKYVVSLASLSPCCNKREKKSLLTCWRIPILSRHGQNFRLLLSPTKILCHVSKKPKAYVAVDMTWQTQAVHNLLLVGTGYCILRKNTGKASKENGGSFGWLVSWGLYYMPA